MSVNTRALEVKDEFLMYWHFLDTIKQSCALQGATPVGLEYTQKWQSLSEVLRRLYVSKNLENLNQTERTICNLLRGQFDAPATCRYTGFLKNMPELEKEVLNDHDKERLLQKFPDYVEYRKIVNVKNRADREFKQWCEGSPELQSLKRQSDRSHELRLSRATPRESDWDEVFRIDREIENLYVAHPECQRELLNKARNKMYMFFQPFALDEGFRFAENTRPKAVILCEAMDDAFGNEKVRAFFNRSFQKLEFYLGSLLSSQAKGSNGKSQTESDCVYWRSSLMKTAIYHGREHTAPELVLELLKAAEEARDAPAELLSDFGCELKDVLQGFEAAARALLQSESKWLSEKERTVQETLQKFVGLLQPADVPEVGDDPPAQVEAATSGPSPLFAAVLGCLIGILATSRVGTTILFAAGCLLGSVIAYRYMQEKVPEKLMRLNAALNDFLEEKGLVMARAAGQGLREGFDPARVASEVTNSSFDAWDNRLPKTIATVDPLLQRAVTNSGDAAFDLFDRRLPQTARLAVQAVGNTAGPYVESFYTETEGFVGRASNALGENLVGGLTNKKSKKGLLDVAGEVLQSIEDTTPMKCLKWFC
eukprot:Skav224125  [mRNA]  locus=scaffold2427:378947:380734:- [translate_table: standard]